MLGLESNSGKRLEVINYERSEGPSSLPACMSIVDRLCSTLTENFNSTYLCRLKKLLIHYLPGPFLQPSCCPNASLNAKEYFLLDIIKDGSFSFSSNRSDLGGGGWRRKWQKPDVATNQHNFSPVLPNAYILRRIFAPLAKYVSFPLANNASALNLCNI